MARARTLAERTGTSETETATVALHSARLAGALRRVIQASPLEGLGPIEVSRVLGIDKTLASRLLSALRAEDSLVGLSALPGTSPLRQFLRAAREHGADEKAAERAEEELRRFEQALQRNFGNRTRLDAALYDAVPEVRRKQQETARQSVYRGMTFIKGVSIDVACITSVVHPSLEEKGRIDTRVLAAFVGIRRLRPSARIKLIGNHAHPARGDGLLREFCRPPNLAIAESRQGENTTYEVMTRSLRPEDAADVFLSEFVPGAPREPGADGRLYSYGDLVSEPYKRLVLNILVHEDVWPGCDFSLRAYDMAVRGMVNPFVPRPDTDQVSLEAGVERTRATAAALRDVPVPGYAEILAKVMGRADLSSFRMFTGDVVYPMYGSQVIMAYEPPGSQR